MNNFIQCAFLRSSIHYSEDSIYLFEYMKFSPQHCREIKDELNSPSCLALLSCEKVKKLKKFSLLLCNILNTKLNFVYSCKFFFKFYRYTNILHADSTYLCICRTLYTYMLLRHLLQTLLLQFVKDINIWPFQNLKMVISHVQKHPSQNVRYLPAGNIWPGLKIKVRADLR